MPLDTTTDILDRVRAATGWPVGRAEHDLVIRGSADLAGTPGTFVWRFGEGDRFLRQLDGTLSRASGGDGTSSWVRDPVGRVRSLEFGEVEEARLLNLVLSGDWLGTPRGLEITAGRDDLGAGDPTRLRLAIGRQTCTLVLDPANALPVRLEVRPTFGGENWSFANYETRDGLSYPARIERTLPAGVVNRYDVESVEHAAPAEPASFAAPRMHLISSFDALLPADLEVLCPRTGLLLVRPQIDGRSGGWFIFDTGAGTNVITAAAADALGLARIGKGWLGMAAGAARGELRAAQSLQLGRLVIAKPGFVEMDLAAISEASRVEIAGIIGYDVLMRAVVEIEVAGPRIALHDPASHQAQELRWEPIVIHGNHPYAFGSVEGHEGWLRLDTGAPQVPLILNAPAVERLRLLEGRDVQKAQLGLPGGVMDVAMGSVAWLELGRRRFEHLTTIFPLQPTGAFNDEYALGNLGHECLKPFRVVFDYANRRVAFVERAGVEERASG